MTKISLFSQIISLLPRNSFDKLTDQHQTDKSVKGINSWTHLVSMIFCHLGQAGSVRDISNGLRSITGNLNHLGMKRAPSKSSISYINKHRSWELFRDYYFAVLSQVQSQHHFGREKLHRLKRKIFIIDSSLVSLSLSLFDWAHYRSKKGAIKLHLMLDYDGCLPVFADLTDGKTHDMTIAKAQEYPQESILVFDRAYVHFEWMNKLDSKRIYFVTRSKSNMSYRITDRYEIPKKDKGFVLEDVDIELTGVNSSQVYPKKLRLVKIRDKETHKELVFLTNQRSWTATTVAEIYKQRWNIEIFFKSLKQNLRIKSFVGTSSNAVMIQVWTALLTMLLVTLLKVKAKYTWHLSNLITFLRLNLFVKIDLFRWLDKPFIDKPTVDGTQLELMFSG